MKRAIGYSRVSTEKQDLVRQEKLISEYCDSHDYILVDIIEEKVSGAKNEVDRVGLMKLLSLQGNEADTIIVAELSRLSREDATLDVLNKVNSLLQKGFNVVFLDNEDKVYTAYSILSLFDIMMNTMRTQVLLLCVIFVLSALAERQPYERYQTIVDRQMFGPPPADFDPTKMPSEVAKTKAKADQELTKEQERPPARRSWVSRTTGTRRIRFTIT